MLVREILKTKPMGIFKNEQNPHCVSLSCFQTAALDIYRTMSQLLQVSLID